MSKTRQNFYTGGCIGKNRGTVLNCVSHVQVHRRGGAAFCAVNSGSITYCMSQNRDKEHAFCTEDRGEVRNCLNLDRKGRLSERDERKLVGRGWNFHTVWVRQDDTLFLQEQHVAAKSGQESAVIVLSSEADLYRCAERINRGETKYARARYVLSKDLDLGGEEWTPIGKDAATPFEGVFDGNGYSIRRFKVRDKNARCAGLFGYCRHAWIMNLMVDGVVTAGEAAGMLAAVNDGGRVIGCHASGTVAARPFAGGLIGINTGRVERCGVAGKVGLHPAKDTVSKTIAAAAALTVTCAATAVLLLLPPENTPAQTVQYPPVSISPHVSKVEESDTMSVVSGNRLAVKLNKTVVFPNGSGEGVLHFLNPGSSSHNVVVQLQIPDEELLRALGKTGRTEEQQRITENVSSYSPQTARVTVAESEGGVPAGYLLETVRLKPLPDGTVLPKGEYTGVVDLTVYDAQSNARAVVDTQFAVTIVVQN